MKIIPPPPPDVEETRADPRYRARRRALAWLFRKHLGLVNGDAKEADRYAAEQIEQYGMENHIARFGRTLESVDIPMQRLYENFLRIGW